MKNWTEHLAHDVYIRLCNCRNKKQDLPVLVNAKWISFKEKGKDKKGFTKEDALISILELLDSNSQNFDLTEDEYADLCR